MPDQYGNLTPAEIAQQSVGASLLVNQLKQQAAQQAQQSALVQKQIASADLEDKIKHFELDQKIVAARVRDRLFGEQKPGEPPPPPPSPQEIAYMRALGIPYEQKASDFLTPADATAGARINTGLALSAAETSQLDVAKGQLDVARGHLALSRDQLRAQVFNDAVNAGANPYLLEGDLTDPKVLGKAFEGVTPTARIQAAASLITARATALEAVGRDALNRAQADAIAATSAADKNASTERWHRLQTLVSGLNGANAAVAQASNAGSDQTQPLAAASRLAFALDQELRNQHFDVPPAAAPEKGFWSSLYDSIFKPKSQSGAAGIDINKLVNPDGSINTAILDQQIPSPTGAATPSAPAPTPTPAPGAAPASLPLSPGGIPTDVMQSVQDLADAANAAGLKFNLTFAPPGARAGESLPPGYRSPGPPGVPTAPNSIPLVAPGFSAETNLTQKRSQLIDEIKAYKPDPILLKKTLDVIASEPLWRQVSDLDQIKHRLAVTKRDTFAKP